tara:strand:- start:372 stop:557 length:186 start_codon:yes stop_codon:yes gene_type:complete
MKYKLVKSVISNEIVGVNKTVELEDGETATISIPFDPANTDYAEYLEWVAEGNTPEPADEV